MRGSGTEQEPLAYGSGLLSEKQHLRTQVSELVAQYIAATREAERLPQHAFVAGFFTDTLSGRDIARLTLGTDTRPVLLAPVTAPGQRTSLVDPGAVPHASEWLPDPGRRTQLWWDEMGPGRPPMRAAEAVRFVKRGEWLGRVDRIDDTEFEATLWGRDTPHQPESARFFVSQVSRGDLRRFSPDAQFYWTLGYVENALGERTSASRLRFRRMPEAADAEADARAQATIEALGLVD